MIEVPDSLIIILAVVFVGSAALALSRVWRHVRRVLPWVLVAVLAWWVYNYTNVLAIVGVYR